MWESMIMSVRGYDSVRERVWRVYESWNFSHIQRYCWINTDHKTEKEHVSHPMSTTWERRKQERHWWIMVFLPIRILPPSQALWATVKLWPTCASLTPGTWSPGGISETGPSFNAQGGNPASLPSLHLVGPLIHAGSLPQVSVFTLS